MIFLVYCSLDDDSISTSLGAADYSYYFVLKRFIPLLQRHGQVVTLQQPATDAVIASYLDRDSCIYLSFTPPDKLAAITLCPAVPVFAWEYSTIPDETFGHPEDDWVADLRACSRAITHSRFAVDVVRAQLGQDYDIVSIPAPLWDDCARLREARAQQQPRGLDGLDLNCTIIDSASYELTNISVKPRTDIPGINSKPLVQAWDGEPLSFSFASGELELRLMGFNTAEPWGVWSKSGYPWIMLDRTIAGEIEIDITVCGYAHNVGKPLGLELGTGRACLLLSEGLQTHTVKMHVAYPTSFLAFEGLDKRAVDMHDPRDIGMGLAHIAIRSLEPGSTPVTRRLDFSVDELSLEGFHDAETAGRWSRETQCLVNLPQPVGGELDIDVELFHMLHNDERTIDLWIGEHREQIALQAGVNHYRVSPGAVAGCDYLRLSNLGLGPSENPDDHRDMGLGIASITITEKPLVRPPRENQVAVAGDAAHQHPAAENILYTTILNPNDGRKNWEDIVTAFVYAFRDKPHTTLLVKITNHDLAMFFEDIFTFFMELHPFQCRLVFIHGYLEREAYEQLLLHSHYIVNASRGEGQCLPLMEFMSSGVPAIAPRNTAMADYIDGDNAFLVESSPELTYWPHDPRQVFRTYWHRINWETLRDAYRDSERVYTSQPDRYRQMSAAAIASLEKYCSLDTASRRLGDFVQGLDTAIGRLPAGHEEGEA